MKKSYISLGGTLLFLCLLVVNLIFKVSPENNTTIVFFTVGFLILFLFQRRKEKRV